MKNEPVHKNHGHTVSEQIAMYVAELSFDAVGLWVIICDASECFMLTGAEFEKYLTDSIAQIIESGAKPVLGSKLNNGWAEQKQYGDTTNDITSNIMLEIKMKNFDIDYGNLWFATPSLIYPHKQL